MSSDQLSPAGAGCAIFALLAIVLVLGSCVRSCGKEDRSNYTPPASSVPAYTPSAPAGFAPLRGNIMPNTRVYDGAGRPVGTIIAVQPTKPNRSFTFRYDDGTITTKDWDAALGFNWYVRP